MTGNLPTGFRDRLLTELRTLPSGEAPDDATAATGATATRRRGPLVTGCVAAALVATTGVLLLAPQVRHPARRPEAVAPTGPAASTGAPVPAVFTVDKRAGIVWLTIADVEGMREEANRRRLGAQLHAAGVPAAVLDDGPTCHWEAAGGDNQVDLGAVTPPTGSGLSGRVIRIDPSKIRPGHLVLIVYQSIRAGVFAMRIGVSAGAPQCVPGVAPLLPTVPKASH